jgi:hypothetical protein
VKKIALIYLFCVNLHFEINLKPKFKIMKKTIYFISVILLIVVAVSSCKKEKETPTPLPPTPTVNPYLNGLGDQVGYPSGTAYNLPAHIQLVSEIRGGYYYKSNSIDKEKYTGPFPAHLIPKNWINYGTGTYVELYMKLYNTLSTDTTIIFPGGLIFCDTLDSDTSNGMYQRGFILQNDTVNIMAQDTAFVVLMAYCLNASMSGSDYDAVYYIGPVTNNPNLNQVVSIMAGKQYPFGEEYTFQDIIWNITDYGQNLTSQEIQYLNALP